MSHWDSVAARTDGVNTVEEFETAAYRLVAEQVIYYVDRHSRVTYALIERYERDFRQVLAPLGVDLQVNRQLRYAYAIPRYAKVGTVTVSQTLLALVLRGIYDESARVGQLNDDGEVICDLVELEEKYRLTTGRDLPSKGELDALIRTFKRWGIAKKTDDAMDDVDDTSGAQPYGLIIRPAIAEVLGETALRRLSAWERADAGTTDADIMEADEEGASE